MFFNSVLKQVKFFLVIVSLVTSLFIQSVYVIPVLAQVNGQLRGLTISPLVNEIQAEPNRNYTTSIEIFNDSLDEQKNIYTLIQTFQSSKEEGQPELRDFNNDDPEKTWVQFQDSTFALKAGERKTLAISVAVPESSEGGSYFFALVVGTKSEDPSNNQVVLEQRIASLLFLKVKGKADRNVSFSQFNTSNWIVDPFFDDILIRSEISTKGKSFLRPNGKYSVIDNSKIITELAINPSEKIILPNSARNFNAVFESDKKINIGTTIFNSGFLGSEANTNVQTISLPLFGSYQIKANLPYTNSNEEIDIIEQYKTVYVFPYKTITFAILIIILGYIIVQMYKKLKKVSIKT